MHKRDFPFFRPVNVVRGCVRCCVPVGVRPLRPFRGSSPCEAGQFWPPHDKQNGHYGRRMENRRGVTSRAKFVKSPLNFYCPVCEG